MAFLLSRSLLLSRSWLLSINTVPTMLLTWPWISSWPSGFHFTIPYHYHSSQAIQEILTYMHTYLLATELHHNSTSRYTKKQTHIVPNITPYPYSSSSKYKKAEAHQVRQAQIDTNSLSCLSFTLPFLFLNHCSAPHPTNVPSPPSLFSLLPSPFSLLPILYSLLPCLTPHHSYLLISNSKLSQCHPSLLYRLLID